jgi:hypothetical protein
MSASEQAVLVRICVLLEKLSLRLPRGYSDSDSFVDSSITEIGRIPYDPDPDDPAWLERARAVSSRIDRATKAISSGQCASALQQEKNLLIERERQAGRHEVAAAAEITLEDAKRSGKKIMEWLADHPEIIKGSLKLGTYEGNGLRCEFHAKVELGPPSIEFKVGCEF